MEYGSEYRSEYGLVNIGGVNIGANMEGLGEYGVNTEGEYGDGCIWGYVDADGCIPGKYAPEVRQSTGGRYASYWNAFLFKAGFV